MEYSRWMERMGERKRDMDRSELERTRKKILVLGWSEQDGEQRGKKIEREDLKSAGKSKDKAWAGPGRAVSD